MIDIYPVVVAVRGVREMTGSGEGSEGGPEGKCPSRHEKLTSKKKGSET
jgi:hypothetical protein